MKVLQLCNKPPYPARDGGCIAMKNISNGLLKEGINLKILTIETQKHPFILDEFPKSFVKKTNIESVFIDTRLNVVDAFSALVTSDSYNISRFFSSDFNKRLIELLTENQYDIIHLESLFLTPYIYTIRKYSKSKIILRSHNLEHLIWERLANLEKNKAKKIYLKHLSKKLKDYEKRTLNEVDGIASISSEDYRRYNELKCNVPLKTIPFGLDLENYIPSKTETDNTSLLRLFHIGSMDWMPNIEAVNWFLDDIFPNLDKNIISFNIAGKNMPNFLLNLNQTSFFSEKEVDSALAYMSKFDVMVVPLLSGSGMRVKIIEAMALGKAVITTSVGLEGIDADDGKEVLIANSTAEFIEKINFLASNKKEVLIANSTAEFIEKINFLANNKKEVEIIAKNARKFIEKHHSNQNIIKDLILLYQNN